jgi:hypothetical protein
MKPWVASLIRGLLILIGGLVGLIGLLMSACGGILIFGGVSGASLLLVGVACIAVCAALLVLAHFAGHRALMITLISLLGLSLIAWLMWHMRMQGLH